jgi:hypothetical protein
VWNRLSDAAGIPLHGNCHLRTPHAFDYVDHQRELNR